MKGMQKIKRGTGFRGLLNYATENGRGQIIGGNMSGQTVRALSREFGIVRRLRPDIEKPVWHNSLRLPAGEELSPARWAQIADHYLYRMGFEEGNPRVYILHDEAAGQHIHIVASRIAIDGSLYLGRNENLISTRRIAEMERTFGLTITPGPQYDPATGKIIMPGTRKSKWDEKARANRIGVAETPRERLQRIVRRAWAGRPSLRNFLERLEIEGVGIKANIAKAGRMNGFSFGIDGVYFRGSQLGDDYKWGRLESLVDYEPERDADLLQRYGPQAGAGQSLTQERAPVPPQMEDPDEDFAPR